MSDVGNTPLPGASVASGLRFTVNDGNTTPTWVEYMVSRYSQTLSRSSAGGTGYAMGNARVLAKPDAQKRLAYEDRAAHSAPAIEGGDETPSLTEGS